MGKPTIAFGKLVDTLQQHYGPPVSPPSTDPLELIIWENIGYLASDKRRAEAFATLKETIGTHPEQILTAKHSALAAIGKAGILPDVSAEKLLTIAKIAYEEFDSDLRLSLKNPLPQAKKALKRFPSIGDPSAEKILLFTRSYPVMALDSNGLRVLCRVGFADEQKSYSATYRSVQNAIHGQLPGDYDSLIVGKIALQQTTKMPSIQNHHMIQAFTTNRADQPFCESILPGLRTAVTISFIAKESMRRRNASPYIASRSRIRYRFASRSEKASAISIPSARSSFGERQP
jgi:endonuclease III